MFKKLLSILIIVFCLFTISACSNSQSNIDSNTADTTSNDADLKEDIIGSWESEAEFSPLMDNTGESMEMILTLTWTFKDDGTFTLDSKGNDVDDKGEVQDLYSTFEGTYDIDGNQLTTVVDKMSGNDVNILVEAAANPADPSDGEAAEFYDTSHPMTFTAEIYKNTLILSNDNEGTYEFDKVETK